VNILKHFDGGVSVKYRPREGGTAQGFPVFGGQQFPNLRNEEYAQLPVVLNVRVKIFDLADEKELLEYEGIRDRIANRSWFQIDKTKLVSADGLSIKIHLEWAEPEGRVVAGRSNNGDTNA